VWFDPRQRQDIVLFVETSTLKRHPFLIQWTPAEFFPGVKRPVRQADHSRPSSAQLHRYSPNDFIVFTCTESTVTVRACCNNVHPMLRHSQV